MYNLGKKTVSPSGGNILVKSQPILKNYMRYRSAKEFPPILANLGVRWTNLGLKWANLGIK